MRGNFITDRSGDKNPNYKHGLRKSRLFSIWASMKSRCFNPNFPSYKSYGGRGITICKEWLEFKNFHEWALSNGYADNLTIDRIDNNGNYEPSNCRWTNSKTQSRNTRRNVNITINDETNALIEWCEIYKINYKTVRDRLHRGWNILDALRKPIETKFKRKVC